MSTTTGSASTQTKTKKEGVQIKGRDVIYLNAPEICFPENAPLKNTEKRELYAILDELFQLEPGGGDEEWSPPDWWIPVPEPEPYDIYILIQVVTEGKKIEIMLGDQRGDSVGTVLCDWGDGTVEEIKAFPNPSHTYAETGQYLIHITGNENALFLRYWNFNDNYSTKDILGLIIKTGAEIAFRVDYYDKNNYGYNSLFASTSFKHIKIMHPKGLPIEKRSGYFQSCYGLQKIELAKKISGELREYLFQNCYALKNLKQFIDFDNISKIGAFTFGYCHRIEKIDLPNCTEISASGFYQCYNLIYVKMQSCALVGNYSFTQCYNLQEIVVADDCTFGTNCFANCYSLYPRPDGSTN